MYSLVLIVLHEVSQLNAVMNAWREAGAPALTILDSVSTRDLEKRASRDDLPLMPTIRDLLQSDDEPRKTMFAVVKDEVVDKIVAETEAIVGDLGEAHKGILIVVPLAKVVGYRGT